MIFTCLPFACCLYFDTCDSEFLASVNLFPILALLIGYLFLIIFFGFKYDIIFKRLVFHSYNLFVSCGFIHFTRKYFENGVWIGCFWFVIVKFVIFGRLMLCCCCVSVLESLNKWWFMRGIKEGRLQSDFFYWESVWRQFLFISVYHFMYIVCYFATIKH